MDVCVRPIRSRLLNLRMRSPHHFAIVVLQHHPQVDSMYYSGPCARKRFWRRLRDYGKLFQNENASVWTGPKCFLRVLKALTCHQTLWHAGNWHHIFPPLLHVSLFQTVPQICKIRSFSFIYYLKVDSVFEVHDLVSTQSGYRCLLSVFGGKSGGDPKEVQRHH